MNWISFHGPYDDVDYAGIFCPVSFLESGCIAISHYLNGNECYTGPGASFGGIVFSERIVETPRLMVIIDDLQSILRKVKSVHPSAHSLVFRLGPDNLYPLNFISALKAALASIGAESIGEITHIIKKSSWKPKSSILRHVNKARNEGLRTVALQPLACHAALAGFKRVKNYAFNFSETHLVQQVELFSNEFHCFGVIDNDDRVCAAILEAQVNSVKLLLAWDQSEWGKTYSSVDYLLYSRIDSAFSAGMEYVDMGTVSDNGRIIREGLVRHKENFSATPYLRNTYRLDLDR